MGIYPRFLRPIGPAGPAAAPRGGVQDPGGGRGAPPVALRAAAAARGADYRAPRRAGQWRADKWQAAGGPAGGGGAGGPRAALQRGAERVMTI
eukprot:1195508-Prorocentrum_minimum.AAC.8